MNIVNSLASKHSCCSVGVKQLTEHVVHTHSSQEFITVVYTIDHVLTHSTVSSNSMNNINSS